ncbi:helix-turn-helix transcriptional regulator [uncultured Paludibaculum sp.]|uniref:helix-turn-helix transcriptional regulator n=1 Tax=uncultured Paludibaculum sp. TaxID=1765020 RepID=UPI002AAC061E|nr:helix-turn-helix transcriptional regulator [uncultured Paludibaculum sp.]
MNLMARELISASVGGDLEREILNLPDLLAGAGQLTRIDRPAGQTPLLAWATALANGRPGTRYRAVALMDPARRLLIDSAALEAAFHFTKAETRLAEQIANGHSPLEAAQALGITIHTVRTYLKRLYQKTGVRTQATLVRKLLQTTRSLPF